MDEEKRRCTIFGSLHIQMFINHILNIPLCSTHYMNHCDLFEISFQNKHNTPDKDDSDKVTYNFRVKSDESHLLIRECLDAHDLWGQLIITTTHTIQSSQETNLSYGDVIRQN